MDRIRAVVDLQEYVPAQKFAGSAAFRRFGENRLKPSLKRLPTPSVHAIHRAADTATLGS